MSIPDKLVKCPIVEALVEVRFAPSMPDEAVLGVVFNSEIKKYFPKFEKLPILQIPNMIRQGSKDFEFKPLYRLVGEDYLIQLGPTVFSVNIKGGRYTTWKSHSEDIKKYFKLFFDLKISPKYKRLGIRYINYFDTDIFSKIDFELKLKGEAHVSSEMHFRSVSEKDGFLEVLQLNNTAQKNNSKGAPIKGSIFDYDVIYENKQDIDLVANFDELVEKAHNIQKSNFFGLLKKDFVSELGPVYEKK